MSMRIISHAILCNQMIHELTPLHYFDPPTNPKTPKNKPAIAWIPQVAHTPPLRDINLLPHICLIAWTNKVLKALVEHLHGRKDAVICAVHDGTLSREVVEDESCVFGGCGEGKEQVIIGGIRGDNPRRRGGEGASMGSFCL